MPKTLKTIQILFRIAKILSKIVFICSIVGTVGCAVGIFCLAVGGNAVLSFMGNDLPASVNTMYAAMATGCILCGAEIALAKIAENYFCREGKAGTPFTKEGAKELFRLGLATILLPVGASLLASVVHAVMQAVLPDVAPLEFSDSTSVALGIMFLVLSLVFRYGAEREAGLSASQSPSDPPASAEESREDC